MTMSQALDHAWLSEPSSQPMESQPIGLGGDSMWSIQSFDSSPSDFDFGNGPESSAKNWQRPATTATVSVTGLESGVEGSDDFSQPLTKLHLNTPEGGDIPSKTASGKQKQTATAAGAGAVGINTPVSPLSPLVAGSHVNIVSPSAPTPASPTSVSKQKRKLGHEKGGNSIDSEDEGSERIIHRTDNVPVNESMDVSGEKERAVVESVKKDGKDGVVSGRRPRKSMRLE